MKMMYEIELELEAKKKNSEKRLLDYSEMLQREAVKYYNKKSASGRKPKKIVDVQINENDTMKVIMESSEKLYAPMKALRTYSSYLINNGMDKLAADNALFRSVSVKEEQKELDDEKIVNIVMHAIFNKNKKNSEFIMKLKELIVVMKMDC